MVGEVEEEQQAEADAEGPERALIEAEHLTAALVTDHQWAIQCPSASAADRVASQRTLADTSIAGGHDPSRAFANLTNSNASRDTVKVNVALAAPFEPPWQASVCLA